MKRIPGFVIALLLLTACLIVPAEELCTLGPENEDIDVYTAECFLRITWPLESEADVSVSVSGPAGVVYQRDYGAVEGRFTSEEIYLEAITDPTSYRVTLTTGADTHIFWVERTDPQAEWDMEEIPIGQSR